MTERNFSRGMIFGIVIIALMFGGLYYMLSAPTSLNGGLVEPSNTPYTKTINVTLYANALGWDYGVKGDQTNPTFNITAGTRIVFTVIEADTAPHTLTIADAMTFILPTIVVGCISHQYVHVPTLLKT